ncbi:MAG: four helix bundle protein [Candidatus Berkelbacteria bacterium]|nr:four helix bundle protein [Candidatus Berkelbacteria bacterium]
MNQEARIKNQGKIKSFTDLRVWQDGHQFVLEIYKITQDFPKEEMFGLTTQLRRAVISFTSNLAEGFSRSTYKEKSRFYSMSLGSLTETQNQLLIARDIGFISKEKFRELASKTITLNKMTNGLIKKSKTLIRNC